ncbi:hypothetical protein M758_1G233100 [Ceratodon purpureus]|nr:hypothetical protein M758_1G233100 [Ceratodon purpureus]
MSYNGFSSLLPEGLESRSMIKRHVDKFGRRVCLRRVCYGLLLLAIAAIVALVGFHTIDEVSPSHSVLSLPTSIIPYYWQRETKISTMNPKFYIEDVISFDSEVLVLVSIPHRAEFPSKESLECRYGGVIHFAYRKAMAVHLLSKDRAAVLCGSPPEHLPWHADSILIEVDQDLEIHPRSKSLAPEPPLQWNSSKVTYEAFPTDQDVVVFVHGINHTRGAHLPEISEQERLQQFQCVYGGHFDMPVIVQAQEVFRCPHPPVDLIHHFAGKKISVKFEGNVLPSVAHYNPVGRKLVENHHILNGSIGRKLLEPSSSEEAAPGLKKHHICSCTMIFNGAKFLKEWVYYNSHLGVEKFFLYDNNSEDNLDEVIASLWRYNVTKKSWPWVKTQEAGFSHCSLMAEPECTWMLFTDIDEYFFPNERFLRNESLAPAYVPAGINAPEMSLDRVRSPSILANFIEEAITVRDPEVDGEVGQISTFCHNFGPSGLKVSPPQGVTQGYTCRLKKTERHKSIVLLSSVDNTLANVIHHFSLKPGYGMKLVRPPVAVINHYKFQVWDEFKTKFHRRAATYVADWTEDRNHNSKDRVPDLGTKAIKPADWESRYCEVQDYGLRNYTQKVFGSFGKDGISLHLPWE